MTSSLPSLSGSVVAVTGGARGIGRATAEAFVREGARVAIGDLDVALAQRTAEELDPNVVAFELDVTDRASFESFLDRASRELGPVDVLVNNAGIMALGRFVEESDETAARQIDINLHGVLLGMKVALPAMEARRRGHVVNIASTAGKAGFAGGATYCATKHAVIGVSEAVLAELRGTGVGISVVMPAIVNTELASGLSSTRGVKTQQPEDVAAAVVAAVKAGTFDVFVPRSVGPISKLLAVLPRPAREAVTRALGADQVLMRVDAARRASYEERAAASAPREPVEASR
ncbi:MAG: SDR family oxidoreductase [Thermoleophilaceae bacterium]|jgi:NADP-dependent 3-hydroxy acid dehydrogenase YdfG